MPCIFRPVQRGTATPPPSTTITFPSLAAHLSMRLSVTESQTEDYCRRETSSMVHSPLFSQIWWSVMTGRTWTKTCPNRHPDLCSESMWHVTSALSLFMQSTSRSTTMASMETSMKLSLLEMWMKKQRSWFRQHTNASCKPSTLVGTAVCDVTDVLVHLFQQLMCVQMKSLRKCAWLHFETKLLSGVLATRWRCQ